MSYIDGFLVAVPTARKDDYIAVAKLAKEMFVEYGATEVIEAWGEDVPDGKVNSMNSAVLREADETVVFSWIIWPSKAVRDACHAKMSSDPRMAGVEMPFDGKRMIFGGFEPLPV